MQRHTLEHTWWFEHTHMVNFKHTEISDAIFSGQSLLLSTTILNDYMVVITLFNVVNYYVPKPFSFPCKRKRSVLLVRLE